MLEIDRQCPDEPLQVEHMVPYAPQASSFTPSTQTPASQQPSGQVVALHEVVHAPSEREQNPDGQSPSQREPQPSGSPHALPSQSGTQAVHDVPSQTLQVPSFSQTSHPSTPLESNSVPQATP